MNFSGTKIQLNLTQAMPPLCDNPQRTVDTYVHSPI